MEGPTNVACGQSLRGAWNRRMCSLWPWCGSKWPARYVLVAYGLGRLANDRPINYIYTWHAPLFFFFFSDVFSASSCVFVACIPARNHPFCFVFDNWHSLESKVTLLMLSWLLRRASCRLFWLHGVWLIHVDLIYAWCQYGGSVHSIPNAFGYVCTWIIPSSVTRWQ